MENPVTLQDLMTAFNSLIASYDTIATVYVAILASITIALTIGIQIYLNKRKNDEAKAAIAEIVQIIDKDGELRAALVRALFATPNFKEEFNRLLDISVNDKMDDKIADYMDTKGAAKKKKSIKGLEKGVIQ
ncbi:MAG: hypothetical protein LBC09_00740 [Helicobacteraceae bacterium]|jgi:GrpB-like predicted nucleotidyltransferase (UPF0157 family)|nr:hypothetical protein [Helicobacteraceae bacterium]